MTDLLDDRKANCPIHQWANVDGYLIRAKIPEHLWAAFHELILARGKFSKYASPTEIKTFGKQAVEITNDFEIVPLEGQALLIVFRSFISDWLSSEANCN